MAQLNVDSIKSSFSKQKDDTVKIRLLREAGLKYEAHDKFLAKWTFTKAIELCRQFKLKTEEAISQNHLASFYINSAKWDTAEIEASKALTLAKEVGSELNMAKSYNIIGNSFRRRSKYTDAINNYLKAVSLFEKVKDDKRTAQVYANIAAVYAETNDSKKGIEYGEKAIGFALKSGDNDAIAKAYFNTGAAWAMPDDNKYIEYYKKGIPFALATNNAILIQQGYYNITNGYYQIGLAKGVMPIEAALYADSSKYWAVKIGNPLNNFYANNINSQIAIARKDFSMAERLLNEAWGNLKEDSSNFTLRIYYSTLSKLKYEKGDYKAAYNYRLKQDYYKDSILKEDQLEEIANLEARFQTEKKQDQIETQKSQLKQKSILNYFFGSSAAALALLSFVSYRNYRNKQKVHQLKITELETEKQLSATQAVLKGEEQERTRLAKDLHDGLGGMLSGIKYSFNNMKDNLIMTPDNAQAFERSMNMLDNGIQEMRRVAHNMMPESIMRYGLDKTLADYVSDINKNGSSKIEYQSLRVETLTLTNSAAVTIYRIVQELISNTLKHSSAKNMLVQLLAGDNVLIINAEDDGKGFDTKIIETSSQGIGWKNIKSRVEFLKGILKVESSANNGTQVNIEIPL
ncbi:MAG: sensor histidine kinase [Ferruginibacter sp.]|nr:sensor histidine kinase [Ferruginibacter sp.]